MMGGMIKVQWESWEGLLILLGEARELAGGRMLDSHPRCSKIAKT